MRDLKVSQTWVAGHVQSQPKKLRVYVLREWPQLPSPTKDQSPFTTCTLAAVILFSAKKATPESHGKTKYYRLGVANILHTMRQFFSQTSSDAPFNSSTFSTFVRSLLGVGL